MKYISPTQLDRLRYKRAEFYRLSPSVEAIALEEDIADILASVPLCENCGEPATHAYQGNPVCDSCDRPDVADRETQHGRYLDCGPGNWDDC